MGKVQFLQWFWENMGAFNKLQSSAPQNLAHALADRASLFSDSDYEELQRIAAWADAGAAKTTTNATTSAIRNPSSERRLPTAVASQRCGPPVVTLRGR